MKINADVLIGTKGNLFLWEGAQKQFSYLQGKLKPTDESIKNFRHNVSERHKYCKENNIAYKHIVFPSKPVIKQRFLPQNIQISSLYEKHYLSSNVLYPKDRLLEVEPALSTYRVLDTHMTDYGKLCVIQELFPELFEQHQRTGAVFQEKSVNLSGDLEKMRSPDEQETVTEVQLIPKVSSGEGFYYREYNNFKEIKSNGGGVSVSYSPDSSSSKRLLVFADSFFYTMMPLLRSIFREIVYVRSEFFKKELVHLYQPDYVVTGNAERYLSKVRNDCDSDFLFFSDVVKNNYKELGPSESFLSSLKFVMSRAIDKHAHKKFVLNEQASLINEKVNDNIKLGRLYNAKLELLRLIEIKPGNSQFVTKLETINKKLAKYKLELHDDANIKKYATSIFKSNLKVDVSNIKKTIPKDKLASPELLFLSSLENISRISIGEIDKLENAVLTLNNLAVIAYLIEKHNGILSELGKVVDVKLLTYLYRMFLSSYLFKPAYEVSLTIRRQMNLDKTLKLQEKLLLAIYEKNADELKKISVNIDKKTGFRGNVKELISNALSNRKSEFDSRDTTRSTLHIFQGKQIEKHCDLSIKESNFFDYISGKSVAIIGPTEVNELNGEEIDSFDVVVRLSYIGKEKYELDVNKYGSRTNISYFSAHLRYFAEEFQELSKELDFICVTLPKFGPEVLELPNVRETQKFNACYVGKENLIQAALLDLLACNPSKVKIFCANLFLTDKPYNPSYPSVEMLNTVSQGNEHRGLNSITFFNHDPINNFLLVQTLFENGVIEVDQELCRVVSLSEKEYMARLQSIYA